MKTLNLETTFPFQGLAELVAYEEGLFALEGLDINWIDGGWAFTENNEIDPYSRHGKMFEQGKADMYNGCEWGNCCRVQDSKVENGKQIGRRSIVTFAGLVVRPESEVYTPQQLAGKLVGVPFYFGTHYLALHMLEGFLERDQINVCSAPNGSRHRYDAMMSGMVEATTLTEPYLTLAEKNGCRVVASAFYHGTEVASDKIDAETYSKFNRAVCEAVRRINTNKKKYLQYFIDYHKEKDPEISTLNVSDLRESRIVVVEPAPIPEDELERTANWIKSWGMLSTTENHNDLVNRIM